MTLYKIFTPIILLGTICAFNSQAYGSTLEIAVEAACEYHPDVFTAQLDVRQAHEGVKQARATILPRISSISEVGFADDAVAEREGRSNPRKILSSYRATTLPK